MRPSLKNIVRIQHKDLSKTAAVDGPQEANSRCFWDHAEAKKKATFKKCVALITNVLLTYIRTSATSPLGSIRRSVTFSNLTLLKERLRMQVRESHICMSTNFGDNTKLSSLLTSKQLAALQTLCSIRSRKLDFLIASRTLADSFTGLLPSNLPSFPQKGTFEAWPLGLGTYTLDFKNMEAQGN